MADIDLYLQADCALLVDKTCKNPSTAQALIWEQGGVDNLLFFGG
jgi:hypothetical protein